MRKKYLIIIYMENKQKLLDYEFGVNSEKNTLRTLRILLDDDSLGHHYDKYSVLDFNSKNYNLICEVKGRRVSSRSYPTTMIGANKTDLARKLYQKGKTILFFFDFSDGLYYFDFKDFDTISKHKWFSRKMGGTTKRGLPEMKVHNFIPVCLLTKVEKYDRGSIDYIKTPTFSNMDIKTKIPIENFIISKRIV
jgi:hypothetical protein